MSVWEDMQLEAGGFAPLTARVDEGATDEIVARSYGGAALGDQVIVQLSAERLGPADDLAMEYLGLEPNGVSEPIAKQSRRAIGFANWALMNDPKHAKYALMLVKRMKATSRRAKAKPGHAWDEFSVMADELNQSVSHFLPSFWEEIGRTYKDIGSYTYASRALNKSLEAERVHALEIDREQRRDVILEFTLGGCLSGKALSDYSKDLQNQYEPDEAFQTLRDLLVRRTLGGMAPTGNMGRDLVRLAKAAQLDSDAELERVLEEIISSPGMARAPLQFWKSVKTPVKNLAKRNPTFCVWLLVHTEPNSNYYGDSPIWEWLDLLDAWGVLKYLWQEDLPAEPEIPGHRAGWLARIASVQSSPPARIFELIEKMAPVIRKEGHALPLFVKNGWADPSIDADILDYVLELDLPIMEVPDGLSISFEGWLREEIDHPRRNSQLHCLLHDERFQHVINAPLESLFQSGEEFPRRFFSYQATDSKRRPFELAVIDHPDVRNAWCEYLDRVVSRLEQGAIVDAQIAIRKLDASIGQRTAIEFPDLFPRLREVNIEECLQRTLQAGVLDEYYWPSLEQAIAEHGTPKKSDYSNRTVVWQFPYCSFRVGDVLIVVRPKSVDPPRDLKLTKRQSFQGCVVVLNDVCVQFEDHDRGYDTLIRWFSDPSVDYTSQRVSYFYRPRNCVLLDDGIFFGGRVLQPGDSSLPEAEPYLYDGERFWQFDGATAWHHFDSLDDGIQVYEVDPISGKLIRHSVPEWFDSELPSGARIHWTFSTLAVLPDPIHSSPLGSDGKLIGSKVIRKRSGDFLYQGIDGRTFEIETPKGSDLRHASIPVALVDQPEGDSKWLITNHGTVIDTATMMAIALMKDDEEDSFRAGQPLAWPWQFLHLMEVRDAATSKKLRTISLSDVKKMMKAGETLNAKEMKQPAKVLERIGGELKKILPNAPEGLIKGVSALVQMTVQSRWALNGIRGKLTPKDESTLTATTSPEMTSTRITKALEELKVQDLGSFYLPEDFKSQNDLHFDSLLKYFTEKKPAPVQGGVYATLSIFEHLPWLFWHTFWRIASNADRHAKISRRVQGPWLDLLEMIGKSGILDLPGRFRLYTLSDSLTNQLKGRTSSDEEFWKSWQQDEHRYVGQLGGAYHVSRHILEYSPTGEFLAPQDYDIEQAVDCRLGWSSEQLLGCIECIQQLKELPYPSMKELEQAATELQRSVPEVAIAWMSNMRSSSYGREPLTKEIRARFGWKLNEVEQAIAALDASPLSKEVVASPVVADPIMPFGDRRSEAFQNLVETWSSAQGNSLRISPDLIGALKKSVRGGAGIRSEPLLAMLSNPRLPDLFQKRSLEFQFSERHSYWREITPAFSPPFSSNWFEHIASLPYYIRLITYLAPTGDPTRQALPELIRTVREYLDLPQTVLPFGKDRVGISVSEEDTDALIESFRVRWPTLEAGQGGIYLFDDGLILGGIMPPHVSMLFRTAQLRDQEEYDRIKAAAALTMDYVGQADADSIACANATCTLRSKAMDRFIEVNEAGNQPEGSWEQDPRLSSPSTVKKVQEHFHLSEDTASCYLQVLALPDPTANNLRQWNEWSAKQVKATVAELFDKELCVEAKRARAGRSYFLPGGWSNLKAPNLPIETWKLSMYGIDPLNLGAFANGRIIPRYVVSDSFEKAWERIEAGDLPQYQEVK